MIEDALFLALGFCTASVLAIASLPLLWARAQRLTRQRLELLVPWSKQEIDAERDGLRAQAAVERRRIEQDAEHSRAVAASREVALGERTVALVRTEQDRNALRTERAELVSELAARSHDLRDAEGQRFATEKALHDADCRIESDAAAARDQALRHDRLLDLTEQRRGTIAALQTRVAGLLATVEDRDDQLLRRDAAHAQLTADRAGLAAEHDTLGRHHAALQQAQAELQRELATLRERAVEQERRLAGRTEALLAAETRMTDQDNAMKRQTARHEALQSRFDALTRDLALLSDPENPSETATDERLRSAIAEAGDEAVALLSPRHDPTPRPVAHPTDLAS